MIPQTIYLVYEFMHVSLHENTVYCCAIIVVLLLQSLFPGSFDPALQDEDFQ